MAAKGQGNKAICSRCKNGGDSEGSGSGGGRATTPNPFNFNMDDLKVVAYHALENVDTYLGSMLENIVSCVNTNLEIGIPSQLLPQNSLQELGIPQGDEEENGSVANLAIQNSQQLQVRRSFSSNSKSGILVKRNKKKRDPPAELTIKVI